MATETSAERLETAERRVYTLDLRKTGATYVAIAEQVIRHFGLERLPRGYDARYAYKDVARELERINRERADSADTVRTLELERLDRMFLSTWPQVTAGHLGAIDRALRIMERRAKLLGLDAPERRDLTSGDQPIKGYVVVSPDDWDSESR